MGLEWLDEAREAIAAARRAKPDIALSTAARQLSHFHPEYMDRWLGNLREAGLPE